MRSVVVAAALALGCSRGSVEVTVRNESGRPIKKLEVLVGETVLWEGGLRARGEKVFRFEPRADGELTVQGVFDDDHAFEATGGYVMRNQDNVIVIGEGGDVDFQ